MKCISLWQPWASLIAIGAKHIETRSWPTKHRGRIAIHAAKRAMDWEGAELWKKYSGQSWFQAIVAMSPTSGIRRGEVVAVADLYDCLPTTSIIVSDRQAELGDFSPGRFGWFLRDIRALREPIPCRGRQQLFDVEIPDEAECYPVVRWKD